MSADHDPQLRTFTSGAIRKAIVEYGQSSEDPQIKAFMPQLMRHSEQTAQVCIWVNCAKLLVETTSCYTHVIGVLPP